MMKRRIEQEWLDELPAADANALASRRDLKRLNTWMGNPRIVAQSLRDNAPVRRPLRLTELGAGDGDCLLRVARRLGSAWSATEATLVDRHNLLSRETTDRFRALGWQVQSREQNVLDWCCSPDAVPVDVVIANLFLHHFSPDQLMRLFKAIGERSILFIAVEPRRSTLALMFGNLVGLIGCNAVTRHDAPVSVRAGFSGNDLSRLWSAKGEWNVRERRVAPFSHLFIAKKNSLPAAATLPHGAQSGPPFGLPRTTSTSAAISPCRGGGDPALLPGQ